MKRVPGKKGKGGREVPEPAECGASRRLELAAIIGGRGCVCKPDKKGRGKRHWSTKKLFEAERAREHRRRKRKACQERTCPGNPWKGESARIKNKTL